MRPTAVNTVGWEKGTVFEMAQIWEYIKIALMNIRSNKGRSVLTMLGIIIGISSVIMVISIGNGVRGQVNSELEGLAGGQIAFYVDSTRKDTTVTFEQADFDAIQANIPHVKGVTPTFGTWGTAEGPKGDFDISIQGGTVGLQYISSDPIIKGKYFSQNEYDGGSNVCIITESNAVALFGTSDVVGMTFDATVWGITQGLRIIGVRQDNATSLVSMGSGGFFGILYRGGGEDLIPTGKPPQCAGRKPDHDAELYGCDGAV